MESESKIDIVQIDGLVRNVIKYLVMVIQCCLI